MKNYSADGYRKLTKDDELSIVLSEFEEFVEKRFGKQHDEPWGTFIDIKKCDKPLNPKQLTGKSVFLWTE